MAVRCSLLDDGALGYGTGIAWRAVLRLAQCGTPPVGRVSGHLMGKMYQLGDRSRYGLAGRWRLRRELKRCLMRS